MNKPKARKHESSLVTKLGSDSPIGFMKTTPLQNAIIKDLQELGTVTKTKIKKAIAYVENNGDMLQEYRSGGMKIEEISNLVLLLSKLRHVSQH